MRQLNGQKALGSLTGTTNLVPHAPPGLTLKHKVNRAPKYFWVLPKNKEMSHDYVKMTASLIWKERIAFLSSLPPVQQLLFSTTSSSSNPWTLHALLGTSGIFFLFTLPIMLLFHILYFGGMGWRAWGSLSAILEQVGQTEIQCWGIYLGILREWYLL